MNNKDASWPHGYKQITQQNWLEPDMPFYFPNISPETWIHVSLEPQLVATVPNDIASLFEVARAAIIQSWFFYPLLTLGAEQLNRVQETAARERCRQLKILPVKLIKSGRRKGQTTEPNFKELIDALKTHGNMTASEYVRWNAARKLRNLSSHPNRQSIYSPGMANRSLKSTAELINKLFEPLAFTKSKEAS